MGRGSFLAPDLNLSRVEEPPPSLVGFPEPPNPKKTLTPNHKIHINGQVIGGVLEQRKETVSRTHRPSSASPKVRTFPNPKTLTSHCKIHVNRQVIGRAGALFEVFGMSIAILSHPSDRAS